MRVQCVVDDVLRCTNTLQELLALILKVFCEVSCEGIVDLLKVDALIEEVSVVGPEPSQQGLPQHVLLHALLVQVAGVHHHVFVHDVDNF